MDGAGVAAYRRDTSSSSQYSFRTSVSSATDIIAGDEIEEARPPLVEDRVFVAVPEGVRHGKNTLLWALENLANDGAGIVIAHVHCPAQMIPMSKFSPLFVRFSDEFQLVSMNLKKWRWFVGSGGSLPAHFC